MKSLLAVFTLFSLTTHTFAKENRMAVPKSEIYSIPLKSIDGVSTTLAAYSGKAILVVNTASRCGYTPQYDGLEKLSQTYGDRGLVVLGFPSNDFGGQEPGTNSEIKQFCSTKKVTFPLFEKASVSGTGTQPLYQWLLKNSPTSGEVSWNFEKFLVSKQGTVLARYKSGVKPESKELIEAIEAALQ